MERFLEKNKTEVLKICKGLSHEIANRFGINHDKLDQLIEECLELPKKTKCQGFVVSKNNTPCTCMAVDNEIYCKRHLYLKNEESLVKRPRCIGIMRHGKRCVHQAQLDSEYCKKHMYQNSDTPCYSCVHYTLNEDNEEQFVCDAPAIENEWCCTKHQSHHRLYAQQFKAKSLHNYKEQVQSGAREPNPLLEKCTVC